MKTIQKTSMYLPMAAVLLIAAFTGSAAAAEKPVPFSGSLQALEHSVFQGPPPGTLLVDASGSGIATHLGRFTLTWTFIVNLADGTGSGPVTFIAANGDTIFIPPWDEVNRRIPLGSFILWKSKPSRVARVDSGAPKGASSWTV